MLGGAVTDEAHSLLYRVVLDADALDPRVGLGALNLTIDEVVVESVALVPIGARNAVVCADSEVVLVSLLEVLGQG